MNTPGKNPKNRIFTRKAPNYGTVPREGSAYNRNANLARVERALNYAFNKNRANIDDATRALVTGNFVVKEDPDVIGNLSEKITYDRIMESIRDKPERITALTPREYTLTLNPPKNHNGIGPMVTGVLTPLANGTYEFKYSMVRSANSMPKKKGGARRTRRRRATRRR